MKKRLIAFRIPPDLDNMAQDEATRKGKTKTDIFIIALAKHFNDNISNRIKKIFK